MRQACLPRRARIELSITGLELSTSDMFKFSELKPGNLKIDHLIGRVACSTCALAFPQAACRGRPRFTIPDIADGFGAYIVSQVRRRRFDLSIILMC